MFFLMFLQKSLMEQIIENQMDNGMLSHDENLGLTNKFYLNSDFINCFDTAYFIMEASSLKIIRACKKFIDLVGISVTSVEDRSFFELIVENIHPSDICKIEEYLDFVQTPKSFTYSHILKLRNGDDCWRDIYVNIVVGSTNDISFPEQLFGCTIDLTDLLKDKRNAILDNSNLNSYSNNELELISSFSKREIEILKLIVKGYSDNGMGLELNTNLCEQ